MSLPFASYLENLQGVNSLDGLQSYVELLRDVFDVQHLVYHSVKNTGEQYAALTYDPKWVDHYVNEGLEKVDPVVQSCFRRFTPLNWKGLDWSGKHARKLFSDGISARLGNQGVSIPIRGPSGQFALFTVNHSATDDGWEKLIHNHMHNLILAAHYINEKATTLDGLASLSLGSKTLSPRETDALTMLALGYNRAQAADRLKISEHTLRVYIEAARFKLGAANTTHAVATAMMNGLICL